MDNSLSNGLNEVQQLAASQPEYIAGEVADLRRSARGHLSRFERVFAAVIAAGVIVFVASVLWHLLT